MLHTISFPPAFFQFHVAPHVPFYFVILLVISKYCLRCCSKLNSFLLCGVVQINVGFWGGTRGDSLGDFVAL